MEENKTDEKVLYNQNDDIKSQNSENDSIDYNLKEIIKKVEKERNLSKEEIEKLKKEALESVNFVEKIDEINLEFNKYVIFTDGKVQLIYEDGEFYVVSSTDATVKKEKKKKEEAKNMYLEYFIRYVLNPIIKQRDINEHSKNITTPTKEKELNKIKKKVSQKAKEIDNQEIAKKDKLELVERKKESDELIIGE